MRATLVMRASLKDLDMRISLVFLAAIAGLQVPGWAEAKDRLEPSGSGFVDTNHPKVTKDYYVVREGPRLRNFLNARAERRQSLKARSTEKNKIEIWRKMLRHATVRGLE